MAFHCIVCSVESLHISIPTQNERPFRMSEMFRWIQVLPRLNLR